MPRKVEVEFEAFGSPFTAVVELDEGDDRQLDDIDFETLLHESSWVRNSTDLTPEQEG